jgi:hypothetical protein
VYLPNCVQTDTASVLMEAIGYIKFLQDQVEVMLIIPSQWSNGINADTYLSI